MVNVVFMDMWDVSMISGINVRIMMYIGRMLK